MTRVLAGCKINLGLRITGVRPNGYHEIDSIFVPVPEPKDELIIEEVPGDPSLTVFCGLSAVDPHKNTLTGAYAAFTEKVPGVPALKITLNKAVFIDYHVITKVVETKFVVSYICNIAIVSLSSFIRLHAV